MIRCYRNPALSYIAYGGILFEIEEMKRWNSVDQILASIHEYTGNGPIAGWTIAYDGLDISIAAGSGIASGVFGSTSGVTNISLPDDSVTYVYARFDGSEKLDIGQCDPEYSPDNITIMSGSDWEDYCAKIATITTSGGSVQSIVTEEYISIVGDLYNAGVINIEEHVHDGDSAPLIDLSYMVTGTIDGRRILAVDASSISGEIPVSVFQRMSHKGLWYFPLDVPRFPASTEDYLTYTAMPSGYGASDLYWKDGIVPTVWRNGFEVDETEYTVNRNNRSVTFTNTQLISAEIEITSTYNNMTADVSTIGRQDVTLLLYKNRKLLTTGYTVTDDGKTTTVVFDDDQLKTDDFVFCAVGYYVSDISTNLDHQQIDDAISTADSYTTMEGSEIITDILLQGLMADSHIMQNLYLNSIRFNSGGIMLFTPGVDNYDTVNSTISAPTKSFCFDIEPGQNASMSLSWDDGVHNRTKEDSNKLVLDMLGAAIVFVIDKSNSMLTNDPTNLRLDACKNIVSGILSKSPDSTFYVLGFETSVHDYSEEWSSDVNVIDAAIDECTSVPNGMTDYILALNVAAEKLAAIPDEYVKSVILITDGYQTISYDAGTSTEILHIIADYNSQSYPIPIYTVGIGQFNVQHIVQFASETDGVFYYCSDAEDINDLYNYMLYGDANSKKLLLQSGNWTYEYDFGGRIFVEGLFSQYSAPGNSSVVFGYSYSDDGITWSEYQYSTSINECHRYWRFVVVLNRDSDNDPKVDCLDVLYIEPNIVELWFNASSCTETPYEAHLSVIAESHYSDIYLYQLNMGIRSLMSTLTINNDLRASDLRKIPNVPMYSNEYTFIVLVKNLSPTLMRLHDIGIIYNTRGV